MQPMTILVIEDLHDVRAVIAELLSGEGYHVLTANSVAEAEVIRERLGLPSLGLVITNLRLTRASDAHEGIDLINRWHTLEPRLPFILMSGNLHVQEIAHLPVTGVWYLAKPFAIDLFRETVRTAIHS